MALEYCKMTVRFMLGKLMESESLRLLLIEDNPIDAQVIRGFLGHAKGLSIELEHVKQLSLGMARLREQRFDAALVDLNLPDSTGLTTVDQVHACNPDVPIVVLTAEEADELALQVVKAGAEDHLCKSELEPKLLLRTIRYAIERAGHRRTDEKLRQMETDYRQADAALSDTRERFRAFISKSAYGYAVLDPAGTILFVNPRLAEILAYSADEMVGHHYTKYVPEGDPEQSRAAFEKVLAQQPVERGAGLYAAKQKR